MRILTPQNEDDLLDSLDRNRETDYLSPTELEIAATLPRYWKQTRNVAATLLMLDAGLRVGEVVKLQYHDAYFQGQPVQTLSVRSAIAKGGHARNVPLTTRLTKALSNLFPFFRSIAPDYSNYMLISNRPGALAITTRTLERIIAAAGEKALGFPVHPHMLRHTFATKLMKLTDIRTVQELLGHKHLTSTQIYTHVNDDDKRKAIELL